VTGARVSGASVTGATVTGAPIATDGVCRESDTRAELLGADRRSGDRVAADPEAADFGAADSGAADSGEADSGAAVKTPLYARVLRLRHVRPNSWQRALFVEGAIAVAIVIVLADLASAWLILALPAAISVLVKFHDVVSGALDRATQQRRHRPAPITVAERVRVTATVPGDAVLPADSAQGYPTLRPRPAVRDAAVAAAARVGVAQPRPAPSPAKPDGREDTSTPERAETAGSGGRAGPPAADRRPRPTPVRAPTTRVQPAAPAVPRLTPGPRPRP
jgi:hypothetical protein